VALGVLKAVKNVRAANQFPELRLLPPLKSALLHDEEPEVQSKVDPRGPSTEPQARSAATSGPQPAPEASLCIVLSAGTAGALTGCFWIWEILIFSCNWCF
jgi:hypothetical protein